MVCKAYGTYLKILFMLYDVVGFSFGVASEDGEFQLRSRKWKKEKGGVLTASRPLRVPPQEALEISYCYSKILESESQDDVEGGGPC